ncbi:MoxR family ATPase [Rhabdobacter roseus]|uniref:MoxR-like ATPase n=1 Tax=Rhabdobacter roseus TaxID=1655419 RepID=A0A840U433_9BACT|nr:MoxR family ATPase [Rhabdobacter roseus]MBB5286850.1 MoxR-like ATPase [Rhabdobacter roseus]
MDYTNRLDLGEISQTIQAVKAEIGRVLIGQEATIDYLLTALLADGHVLLEGVPGVAKTLTAKLVARTIDLDFGRIQFTPDLMPSDVLGTSIFNPKSTQFEFQPGPIFANIVLVDEVNRAPAKTQSALFEVMEERQITIDGHTYPLAAPFLIIATQNPIEHEGTYRLPEAQLDRFLFKLRVDYPSPADEVEVLRGHHARRSLAEEVAALRPVLAVAQLAALRETVRQVHVEENLFGYMVQITAATRAHPALYLGASPRASVALLNGAKALAAIRGRDFVTPDDVQELAYPVLRHRLMLTAEREMEGGTPDDVVRLILEKVEVPR